jgi:hypothetical protein
LRPEERFVLSRWLTLRGLGVVSGVAFASFGVQVGGLVGSRGILPAVESLALLERWHEGARFVRAPTVFWLGASDRALEGVCTAGVALSTLLVAGVAPRTVLLALWAGYLSLTTVSANFLGYQWDALLLEALFVALFLAPPVAQERLARDPPPPRAALLLARLLLAKLMFLSGFAKLSSGDPTWRNLTALDYHYWTQPLPTWTSAWAAALPHAVHAASVVATLAIELALPFLLFAPRPLRRAAACVLIAFQVLLLATGNFAFFNLLTIVLCVPALDDACLARAMPRALRQRLDSARIPLAARACGACRVDSALVPLAAPGAGRSAPPLSTPLRRAVFSTGVALLLAANALVLAQRFAPGRLPEAAGRVLQALAPWGTVNLYGLFAVMTTKRPEILLEGTRDGVHWRPYEFRWKPGRLDRAPGFVAPHQPRLDWEMWFAALRGCRRSPWFARFAGRLLEGSEPVLRLLDSNPFPDAPPRAIRSTVYRYRFAAPGIRERTGRWWIREEPGAPFCRPFRARR